MPFSLRRRSVPILWSVALLAAGCNALSCSSKPTEVRRTETVEREDPLAGAREQMRKAHDLETCKSVIQLLNGNLTQNNTTVPELSVEDRNTIERELQLTPEEIREIATTNFTTLDANYLFECLLVHDGVRTLGLDMADDPSATLRRARQGFAWAMRQVWFSGQDGSPLPASYVLKRGYGGRVERAAVAAAVFQQLGIDACWIGDESAGSQRMWAIGAVLGSDIWLFDPHQGKPILGADGKIATLKSVRAQPSLLKDVEIVGTKTDLAALVNNSKVYLAPPLSALSPRAEMMEKSLPIQPPLRLAISARTAKERLAKTGETVHFWNPNQTSSPVRSLAHFLPTDEGGFDRTPRGACRLDMFRNLLAPRNLMPATLGEENIAGDPGRQLRTAFSGRFIALFDLPNQPRDQILRGQFDEATRTLVEHLRQNNVALERISREPRLEAEAEEWIQKMRAASARLERAQSRPGEVDPADAKRLVDGLLKGSAKIRLFIDKAAAEPFGIHVTFQLALCKHEMAIRHERHATATANDATARDAWENAAGWWRKFLSDYGNSPILPKNMGDHARAMLAEAETGTKKTKVN